MSSPPTQYRSSDVINCLFHEFTTARLEAVVFSVDRPTVWNSLPDDQRDPAVDSEYFMQNLKTHLFTGRYGTLAY